MRLHAIAIVLSLAAVPARLYHPVTIQDLAAGKVRHTHVEVSGFVTYQTMEVDGDRHVRICDSPKVRSMNRVHCVVGECLPWRPCPAPKIGENVKARGIRRHDDENGHKWEEVHPLEWWSW